ncbi:39214_t:CDS:10 [Gigaspora margarita]|uniref:39214_t:CDS:1 n=1 Tax=Gigaspora margarita TaxID=4874 RepID=A0ABN7UD82_GIGMA|nr:39214_t:CDS:10 [Gigaspora margarita]
MYMVKKQAIPKRLTKEQMRKLLLSAKKKADKMPEEEGSFRLEDILIKEHGDIYPLRSAIIKFGGFHLSYIAGLKSDMPNFTEHFGFRKLINTIAHELSHYLLANYKLDFGRKHEPEHAELTKDIEAFLLNMPEVKDSREGALDLSDFPNLEYLNCCGNKLTDITLSPNITNLSKLDLRDNNFPKQEKINQYGHCQKCFQINTKLIKKFIQKQKERNQYSLEGGFSQIYKAKWKGCGDMLNEDKTVVLKSLNNSQNITLEFLQEIANTKLVDNYTGVVPCYGISQDPQTKNYVMAMRYIKGGNLRQFLQNKVGELTSDIYSFGIIATELLANTYPYPEMDERDLALAVCNESEQEYNTFSQSTPYQIHPTATTTSKMIDTKQIITKLQQIDTKELITQLKDIKKFLQPTIPIEELEEKDTDIRLIRLLKRGHKYTKKKLTEEEKRFVLLSNRVLNLEITEEEFAQRFEFIAGWHGQQELCFGCDKLNQQMITTGDYSPQHSREAKKPKNIFLTMVKYERNSLGEKQVPEFYCQTCAKIILKRIEKELINFSVSDARTTTLMMASNG